MFLAGKMQQLTDEFAFHEDPHERLSAVVDRTRQLPALPPADRVDANRVRGCVSVVWLVAETREGRCYFRGDAESPMVRALVALVAEFFSGASAAEIAGSQLDPLEALGLTRNLSPTRRNGLTAVRAAIAEYAARSLRDGAPA